MDISITGYSCETSKSVVRWGVHNPDLFLNHKHELEITEIQLMFVLLQNPIIRRDIAHGS
jgi:hypothetical protein